MQQHLSHTRQKDEQSDDKTGCKQAKRLARLSKALHLEVKLNVEHTQKVSNMDVYNGHFRKKM